MKIFLLFIAIFTAFFVQAQDTIIRKDGSRLICRIISEDSARVNFTSKRDGERITSFLSKDLITEIKYFSQIKKEYVRKKRIVGFGLGYGQEFGGIGAQIAAYTGEQFGVFCGFGYNLSNLSCNVGLKLNLRRRNAGVFNPYIETMYGYNEVVSFADGTNSKTFYGVSMGAGIEWFLSRNNSCALITGLTIPIRERSVELYAQENRINIEHRDLPIKISVGFVF